MEQSYSVGIPVRNEEKTIVQTLESVLSQTITPEEIIVCINGSSDNTGRKVTDMALAEKTIIPVSSMPGKANAWNQIASMRSKDTVMFCDGDVIINPHAAENMLKKFAQDSSLIIVGGANAYYVKEENTFFSRYFLENSNGTPVKQDWVCGRLYMARMNELFSLANQLEIELMPVDIINEDGFLEMLTTGYREIIDSAYNLSMHVSNFHDWMVGFKRIVAGQRQLKNRYPQYFGDSDFSLKRLKNYISRFGKIQSWEKRIGITSLFLLRTTLNVYYKFSNKLDYNPVWEETKSTKIEILP